MCDYEKQDIYIRAGTCELIQRKCILALSAMMMFVEKAAITEKAGRMIHKKRIYTKLSGHFSTHSQLFTSNDICPFISGKTKNLLL